MKKEFPGYFANHADDIDKLWENCFFVLDTNVLLNLYRYSDATRAELLQVFHSLSERLWIPHQVAQEYLVNRLQVIGEQAKAYDDSVRKIEVIRKGFENSNYHPFVSVETLAECVAVFERLVEELNSNRAVHEGRISSDEIKDVLESLFEGRVGKGFDRTRLEQIIEQGAIRYEQKVPPGYCDVKKGGDSNVFSDLCKPYGDYIVWLQIIEHAKELGRSVVFVTGDSKDDWWMSFQGKTVGPRPQLIEEFLSETGNSFYMYSPDRFLERANSYLQQETSPEAMSEIQSLHEEEGDDVKFDSSIFDSAIKSQRPGTKEEFPEIADLPWNEEHNRTLNDISEQRKILTDKAFVVSKELIAAKSFQKILVRPYEDDLMRPSDVLEGEDLRIFRFRVAKGKERISQLEDELSGLRSQVFELISMQKSLLLDH
ncbi:MULTISPECIES: PIN-like domain-containing protein [unclassified Pseudomonas]|uniref:PIN-like domain-containing protein n=1 Tax=unclassified Pseudomonas TaxID=196821 RepID=UPI000C2FE336|nr:MULTISPECIES: PIN-like domain-containing protein [unclassified Pseudomonas]MCU1738832.1 PIN domain-containing protein [Pseudomonas sp. 20S_6.2_Bac1]